MARQESERAEGARAGRARAARGPKGGRTRAEAGAPSAPAGAGSQPGPGSEQRVCSVPFCPIGLAFGALQGAAPEATAHLLRAAQELLLAVRAVIDERVGATEDPQRLERIEVT
ncbi:hypothetical protein HRbin12_00644 [bacterium HR12]|nr:hypothetical protein HRbin12_00644 [bacterium HR12]